MQPGPLGTVDPRKNAVFAEWEMRGLHNVLQGAHSEGVSLPFREAISADFSLPNKRICPKGPPVTANHNRETGKGCRMCQQSSHVNSNLLKYKNWTFLSRD